MNPSQLWYEVSYETLPTEDSPGTREISHAQGLSSDPETAIKEATSIRVTMVLVKSSKF